MPLFAMTGTGGEVWAGGRVAATLGAWRYKATPYGWLVGAALATQNERLLDTGAEFELRLFLTEFAHIGTDIYLTRTPGRHDRITVTGDSTLEKVPRYGHQKRAPTRRDGSAERPAERIEPVRATRGAPPGDWQPPARRVVVRQPGYGADRPWRR